jgi:thymidylate kinase
MEVDATRPVMLGGAAIAVVLGLVAYRQVDDRRQEPVLSSLFAAIRGRRSTKSLLIAVEGDTREDTSVQARRLAAALRAEGLDVLLAADPEHDERRLRTVLSSAELAGVRAQALVAAAVRADVVERQVRPALDEGSVVVMERYVDSPLAHFSATSSLEHQELEGPVDWATGRLRPDLTILLDRPDSDGRAIGPENHWRVQRLLSEMAAADPDRYVVVEAEGDVAERVRSAIIPLRVDRCRLSEPTGPKHLHLRSPHRSAAGPSFTRPIRGSPVRALAFRDEPHMALVALVEPGRHGQDNLHRAEVVDARLRWDDDQVGRFRDHRFVVQDEGAVPARDVVDVRAFQVEELFEVSFLDTHPCDGGRGRRLVVDRQVDPVLGETRRVPVGVPVLGHGVLRSNPGQELDQLLRQQFGRRPVHRLFGLGLVAGGLRAVDIREVAHRHALHHDRRHRPAVDLGDAVQHAVVEVVHGASGQSGVEHRAELFEAA